MPLTYPSSDLTLPKATFLPNLVWTSKLLHVFAEIALSAVLRPQTGIAFSTHSGRAFDLQATTGTGMLHFNNTGGAKDLQDNQVFFRLPENPASYRFWAGGWSFCLHPFGHSAEHKESVARGAPCRSDLRNADT
ncbi:hypothetical protein GOODEAATRI_027769 [Goodea atripinnis]|uniref:Uncharacterized protein n=1 Tax=Goodea atripinnis TaxID=208336 RepID=A0ABV0Q1K6_9TELE